MHTYISVLILYDEPFVCINVGGMNSFYRVGELQKGKELVSLKSIRQRQITYLQHISKKVHYAHCNLRRKETGNVTRYKTVVPITSEITAITIPALLLVSL